MTTKESGEEELFLQLLTEGSLLTSSAWLLGYNTPSREMDFISRNPFNNLGRWIP
jgi:hypothetical protein